MAHRTAVRIACIALMAAPLAARVELNYASSPVSLQFVTVGDPGNVADANGYGAVGYSYQMGQYDVTLAQYTAFLNSVAATDPYGLYNPFMGTDYATQGISQTGSPGSFSYAVTGSAPGAANMPVYDVTWGDAARFCNWLQNGQPAGPEGAATTENGSYTLAGGTTQSALMGVTRNSAAAYVIPTENEWYKAAYYKSGGTSAGYWTYPTQSDSPPNNALATSTSSNEANFYTDADGYTDPTNLLTPVGTFSESPSAYGAFDMGGDVWQWNETDVSDTTRGMRGGSYYYYDNYLASSQRSDYPPQDATYTVGFRVAVVTPESVPEPASLALLFSVAASLAIWRVRRKT
jgi:formylglycine-generating enzyme required for sulfatase activity